MHELETARVLLEQLRRVLSAVFGPEYVQFESYIYRVGLRDKLVKQSSIRCRHEFVSVRVITELQPGGFDLCARTVEDIRSRLHILRCELALVPYPRAQYSLSPKCPCIF